MRDMTVVLNEAFIPLALREKIAWHLRRRWARERRFGGVVRVTWQSQDPGFPVIGISTLAVELVYPAASQGGRHALACSRLEAVHEEVAGFLKRHRQ